MAGPTAANLAKVARLLDVLRDLRAKEQAAIDEIEQLLEGGVGIGAKMSAAAKTFNELYRTWYHTDYVWHHASARPNLKRLVLQLGLDEVQARMTTYFSNRDRTLVQAKHPFDWFVSRVNSISGKAVAEDEAREMKLDAPIAGGACTTHNPPCKSAQEHTRRNLRDLDAIPE